MAGLISLMPRRGVVYVRQPVKRQLAVALESFRSRTAIDFLVGFGPGVGAHGIDQARPAAALLEGGVNKSPEHPLLEGLMKIPHLPQLVFAEPLLGFFRKGAYRFRLRVPRVL